MTLLDILLLLLIAAVAGAIGQAIAGRSAGGFVVSIALGFIGALIGRWIARAAGLPEPVNIHIGNQNFPLIWSIVGATLFVVLVQLITNSSRRH